MKGILQCAKEYGCVEEVWGCNAHLSKVMDMTLTARVEGAQAHTNYQLSMTAKVLVSFISLDGPVDVVNQTTYKMVGSLTLCFVLLNYLKMQAGHLMIAEVHEEGICRPTHVIIPPTKEAERMVGMMNKNLPAFLHHMLLEHDCTKDFVKDLLKKLCETSLLEEVKNCKWDSTTRMLTIIKKTKKHKKELKAFKGAARFKDKFGLLNKGPKPKPCLPKEVDSALVKTFHDRHQDSTLRKGTTIPTEGKECEIDLTHKTNGDSASQSSSSAKEDNTSNKGSCSKTSIEDGESMGAKGGG
jgi:hypothetical protein